MLKFHKGPTQTQTHQMGQSPIKKLKKFSQKKKKTKKNKIEFPTLFQKYPIQVKPKNFLHNLRK